MYATNLFHGDKGERKEMTIDVLEYDTASSIVVPKYTSWCTIAKASYPTKTSVKLYLDILVTSDYCFAEFYLFVFDKPPHV